MVPSKCIPDTFHGVKCLSTTIDSGKHPTAALSVLGTCWTLAANWWPYLPCLWLAVLGRAGSSGLWHTHRLWREWGCLWFACTAHKVQPETSLHNF